jgi:hypothetical protein
MKERDGGNFVFEILLTRHVPSCRDLRTELPGMSMVRAETRI